MKILCFLFSLFHILRDVVLHRHSVRPTDLLGRGVGLLGGAGHQAGGHGDAGLFQQADAHVLVQGEVPLLLLQVRGLQLGRMASEQTGGTAEDLDGREERAEEDLEWLTLNTHHKYLI